MVTPLVGLLGIGLALLGLVGLGAVSDRVDRVLTRLAIALFRDAIEAEGSTREERERLLESVHATTTYPAYAATTLLQTAIVGIAGSLIGAFALWFALVHLPVVGTAIREALHLGGGAPGPTPVQTFGLLAASSATFGAVGGGLTYVGRWWLLERAADRREVLIDESIARTISFVYALSRSGMAYPDIVRTVAENREAFGESAEEVAVVGKDMDLFGADLVAALQRIADRTPSEKFSDFAENFANVLRTGRNVPEYLREQYDQHQEERVEDQKRVLELFTALGEAYVAGLVAGPLFLITILLVFGLLTGGMLEVLRVIVYGLVPVATLGFVVYLDRISESLTAYRGPVGHDSQARSPSVRRVDERERGRERADGGARADATREMNRIRLAAYERVRRVRAVLRDPVETVIDRPVAILYVTVPIALAVLGVRLWPAIRSGSVAIALLDDALVQATLFLTATFAVVREYHTRRLRRIEAAVPDLLDRLASTNEAGMTFTEALERVDRSDLGALDDEVSKLLADVEWGARTETALERFSARLESTTIARIVALLRNAMTASGDLGPVLRIAADESREDRRLERQRRQELFMYVVIIYLSFAVFVGIGIALQTILVPAIPSADQLGTVGGGGAPVSVDVPIDPVTGEQKDAYTLLLYHAAAVQAICSGFVAGQMGEGSLKDGAKHVAILLAVAYGVFLAFGG